MYDKVFNDSNNNESIFKPGTNILKKKPTNREALNVARNALHTLVHSKSMGGSIRLKELAETANEKESDIRYAIAILDSFFNNKEFLDVIKASEECSLTEEDAKYYLN